MNFIPVAKPSLTRLETKYVTQCLKSTWISSSGHFIDKFERQFAKLTQSKYAISVTNGTAALHLALLALDIGPGDEVIVPALTFVATANAVRFVGATPIFVDIDPHTWTIDSSLLPKLITRKTRAIIPVHLYGYPCDMDPILAIAKRYKLEIIEDAAEAHEAMYKGKKVGSMGTMGCFSFYGNKIITTGEGGMITLNNAKLKNKIELLKNHGMSKTRRYFHPIIGYNYRMTNVQAAIGCAQIEKLAQIMSNRRRINDTYRTLLKDLSGIVLQPQNSDIQSVCWLFSLLITPKYGKTRDQLAKYLKNKNIDSRPFFYPLTSFAMYKSNTKFPQIELVSIQGLNLPSFPEITHQQLLYITTAIKQYASKNK